MTGRKAQEGLALIVAKSLFTSAPRTRSASSARRSEKHLASHGAEGQPPARVRLVDRDRYLLA